MIAEWGASWMRQPTTSLPQPCIATPGAYTRCRRAKREMSHPTTRLPPFARVRLLPPFRATPLRPTLRMTQFEMTTPSQSPAMSMPSPATHSIVQSATRTSRQSRSTSPAPPPNAIVFPRTTSPRRCSRSKTGSSPQAIVTGLDAISPPGGIKKSVLPSTSHSPSVSRKLLWPTA